MTDKTMTRRDFLKVAAVSVAAVAGLRVIQRADATSGPEGEHQWAMIIDQRVLHTGVPGA
jgi:hypothetical protein